MRLIIYTDSDYLEAHLTEIASDSNPRAISLDSVPQLLTDTLKKLASDSATPSPKNSRPSKSRTR